MKNPKILLIENDSFLTDMYSTFLQQKGAKVEIFSNADGDIIQRVLEVEPDLISINILLKDRGGTEAVKILKDDEQTKNIPIVFLTNLNRQEDVEAGRDLGIVKHIVMAEHEPIQVAEIMLNLI